MPNEFPPKVPENESNQEELKALEVLAAEDGSIAAAVELVNKAAESGEEAKIDAAWDYLHGLSDMLDKIDAYDGRAPGDDASDDEKFAWNNHDRLREIAERSAGEMPDEARDNLVFVVGKYREAQMALEDALESGQKIDLPQEQDVQNVDIDRLKQRKAEIEQELSKIGDYDFLDYKANKLLLAQESEEYKGSSENARRGWDNTIYKGLRAFADAKTRRDELLSELEEVNQELVARGTQNNPRSPENPENPQQSPDNPDPQNSEDTKDNEPNDPNQEYAAKMLGAAKDELKKVNVKLARKKSDLMASEGILLQVETAASASPEYLDNEQEIKDSDGNLVKLTDKEALARRREKIEQLKKEVEALEKDRDAIQQKVEKYEKLAGGVANSDSENDPDLDADEKEATEEKSYSEALREYARASADVIRKGEGGIHVQFWKWQGTLFGKRGREKRAEALAQAGETLKEEVLKYVKEFVDKKKADGEYSGTEEEIKQQMSDEAFDMMRDIFENEVDAETKRALGEKLDSRMNKVISWFGGLIQEGEKGKNSLKAGVAGAVGGFARGVVPGFLTGVFGAGVPVTLAVGAVSGATVGAAVSNINRGSVRINELANRVSSDENIYQSISDEKYEKLRAGSQENFVNEMLKKSSESARRYEEDVSDAVKRRLGARWLSLAVGGGVGGVFGGLTGRVAGSATRNWFENQFGSKAEATSVGGQEADTEIKGLQDKLDEAQRKIDDLEKQNAKLAEQLDKLKADGGVNSNLPDTPALEINSYANKFPWDWAADKFGADSAMNNLERLVDLAKENGYDAELYTTANGSTAIRIGSTTDTVGVLRVLDQFTNRLS